MSPHRFDPNGTALREAVASSFAPARGSAPGRVGIELELIPVTRTDPPRPVAPSWLAGGFDAAFVAAARPSFEPGGQLELSPPPQPTGTALLAGAHRLLRRAERIAAGRGARLVFRGVNLYHGIDQVPLRTPAPRYLAMQRLFDATGPDGRRMMRLTAGLQICVDLQPGPAGRQQWLVANLAGPALSVAFANCAGARRSRTAIWCGVDPVRTGYDGRHLDPNDPVGCYTAFAAAAPRFPIPAAADPGYHLSTLFPPVRPRGGYVELRFLDSQPPARLSAAVAAVLGLLCEPRARQEALELLLPEADRLGACWAEAAAGRAPVVAELLAIAAAGARRLPPGYLPPVAANGVCRAGTGAGAGAGTGAGSRRGGWAA